MIHANIRNEQLEKLSFPISQQYIDSDEDLCGRTIKRIFDIVMVILAIFTLAPLLACLALAVKLSDGGPALFGQIRIGADGKPFKMWKFRSMVPEADVILREHLAGNPLAEREWRTSRKLKCDPRITNLGRVLRKYSVDELPQLFNILSGEMSFVGPRPITEAECSLYGLSLRHYMSCRPGLTGIWQVCGRNDS